MNDFDTEKANGEHFHMEVDTKGEQFEAGIEEESSEEHYSRLVNSLWHKGIQLVTREDNFASQAAASREKLQASYTRLAAIRDELNTVKSKVRAIINTGDNTIERWRSYTSFTHPLRYLPRRLVAKCAERGAPEPQMCTQAYCKFVQMAAAHPSLLEQPGLLDNCQVPFRSIHLCEAPGAFVHAARDCLAKKGIQLDWRMNSLNPAYEQPQIGPSTSSAFSMDDQLMLGNQDRILFGPDNSGDISHWDQSYLEKVISTENGGKFHLVTGDGGFDCTDEPENQESRIRPLIKQQFRVACGCLCSDGNLLLKVYIFFEPETIQLLADICGHFAEVHCLKPPNSKPGNSEVYLLCMGFADNSNSLGLPLSEPFLDRVEHCARFFADHQMRFIQFNLRTFRRLSQSERCKMEFQKCTIQEVMAEFLRNQIAPEPKIINFNLLINGQDDEVQTAD